MNILNKFTTVSVSTIVVVLGLTWYIGQQTAAVSSAGASAVASDAAVRAANSELRKDSIITARKLDSLSAVATEAQDRANSAHRRAPSLVASIKATAGDSAVTVAKVDTLVVNHAEEVAGLHDELKAVVAERQVVIDQLALTVKVKDDALASSAGAVSALRSSERGRKRDRIVGALILIATVVLLNR